MSRRVAFVGQGQAEEEQRAQLERQQHSLWADCSWRVTWQRLASHGRASTSNGQVSGHVAYSASGLLVAVEFTLH